MRRKNFLVTYWYQVTNKTNLTIDVAHKRYLLSINSFSNYHQNEHLLINLFILSCTKDLRISTKSDGAINKDMIELIFYISSIGSNTSWIVYRQGQNTLDVVLFRAYIHFFLLYVYLKIKICKCLLPQDRQRVF